MRLSCLTTLLFCLAVSTLAQSPAKPSARQFRIGFFEAGSYAAHAEIRDQFRIQLESMLPSDLQAVYVPQGFKTADWDREAARRMAAELAADPTVDLVLAFGPWTVEDLLAAGFDRPIIAVYRFDPQLEGLLDSTGRPIVDNLTLRQRRGKIESDLVRLKRLKDVKKLAFLYFPAGDEQPRVIEEVSRLGQSLGFEVITAEAYDSDSAFAFFKAYGRLAEKADALYVGPLWGFDNTKTRQFYETTGRDNLPVFSSEGEYQAFRGALAAGSGESLRVTARYAAWKALRIMQGAIPADLPVSFPEQAGLTINEVAARYFSIPLDHRLRLAARIVQSAPPTDAETFRLAEAIDRALVQNPGYLSRYEALEAAVQAAGQARAVYLPQVKAGASAFYHDDNTVHNDDRFENRRYRAGLSLDQEILSFGAIRDIQLAANNRDIQNAELTRATLDVEYAVTVAFLNHLKASSLYDIRATHRRIAEECRQIADVREKLGESDHADVLRWEDAVTQAVRSLEEADHDLHVARVLLNTLLGRPAEMTIALETGGLDGSLVDDLQNLLFALSDDPTLATRLREYLTVEAVGNNPSIEIRDLALSGQRTRLSGNSADFLPKIGFRASLNLVDEMRPTGTFEEEHVTWSAGVRLELPLFLGTGRFKERKKLYAELSELEYLKDDLYLEIAGNLDIQLNGLVSLSSRLFLSVNSARLAQEYMQLVVDQYASGRRDISDLLEAVENDRRARIAVTADQSDYYKAAADLVRELGWSAHESGQPPDAMLLGRLASLARQWLENR